jgi:hypothetical protein
MKIGARSQFAKSQGASVQHFWDYWKSEYFCIEKLTDHAHGFLNRSHDIGSRVPRGLGPTLALELARSSCSQATPATETRRDGFETDNGAR